MLQGTPQTASMNHTPSPSLSTVHWKQLDDLIQLIGNKFPLLLGSITAPWVGKPYFLVENRGSVQDGHWYTRAHRKVMEYILATEKSLSVRTPHQLIRSVSRKTSFISINFCTKCLKWGNHLAYDQGLARCSVPGHCLYCGIRTSRALYKQHKEECKAGSYLISCQICKKIGEPNDHHPANLALCLQARPFHKPTLLAIHARQCFYNNRLAQDISNRIRIKGGNPVEILTSRRDIWWGASKADHYLAIMSQVPDMLSITSTWDVTTGTKQLTC